MANTRATRTAKAPFGVTSNAASNAPVDISEPRTAQVPQRDPAHVDTSHLIDLPHPDDSSLLFISTTPQQRIVVLLALATSIKEDKLAGNKFVNIYSIIKAIRAAYNVPVELGLVQDCLDTMIYKGVVRKFDNSQAETTDGQMFYAVSYGLSRAAWTLVEAYGIEAPEWKLPGLEFNAQDNPYDQVERKYDGRGSVPRVNGIRNNMAQNPRVNTNISI